MESIKEQGNLIKEKMEERGISIKELSHALSVTTNTVRYWQANKSQPPLMTMYRVAECLQCCIHHLIVPSPKPPEPEPQPEPQPELTEK